MGYDVYSKFDIDKHAENFINYLEVVIDPLGVVNYAVPSHQMYMENILKRRLGEKEFKMRVMGDPEARYDYLIWLCKNTGCIPVWNEFYLGNPNQEQLETIKKLSNKKYSRSNTRLYQGKV